jgi:hypothetical protein
VHRALVEFIHPLNIGLGIQFAAVGAAVFELAADAGLGDIEPVERYTQEYHP